VEIPDESSQGYASMTVDGGLKDNLHLCVHLSNTDPEYSWKVDLKQLYDIEQFIVNGNPSGEYKENTNTTFSTPNINILMRTRMIIHSTQMFQMSAIHDILRPSEVNFK